MDRIILTGNRLIASIDFIYSPWGEANTAIISAGAQPQSVTAIQGDKFYRILENTYRWDENLLKTIGNDEISLDFFYEGSLPKMAIETFNLSGDTSRVFHFTFFRDNLSQIAVYDNKGNLMEKHNWLSYDSEPNAYAHIWWVLHVGIIDEPIFIQDVPVVLFMQNTPGGYIKEVYGDSPGTIEYNSHFAYTG